MDNNQINPTEQNYNLTAEKAWDEPLPEKIQKSLELDQLSILKTKRKDKPKIRKIELKLFGKWLDF